MESVNIWGYNDNCLIFDSLGVNMPISISESPYYGAGSITREQFLFYEMRTTARLMNGGLSDEEILKRIIEENLFQYQYSPLAFA